MVLLACRGLGVPRYRWSPQVWLDGLSKGIVRRKWRIAVTTTVRSSAGATDDADWQRVGRQMRCFDRYRQHGTELIDRQLSRDECGKEAYGEVDVARLTLRSRRARIPHFSSLAKKLSSDVFLRAFEAVGWFVTVCHRSAARWPLPYVLAAGKDASVPSQTPPPRTR